MNTLTLHPRSKSLYSGPSKISDDTQNLTTNVLDSVATTFRLSVDSMGLKLGEGQRIAIVVTTALTRPDAARKMADEMIGRTKSESERIALQKVRGIIPKIHAVAIGGLLALVLALDFAGGLEARIRVKTGKRNEVEMEVA